MQHDNDPREGKRGAGMRWYLGVLALIALAVAVSVLLQPDAPRPVPAAASPASR